MNPIDFGVCVLLAAITSASVYVGWYWATVFCVLFYVLVLANVCLFHLQMPQPRWVIGVGIPKVQDETEETESDVS